jgi:hypothetical protein
MNIRRFKRGWSSGSIVIRIDKFRRKYLKVVVIIVMIKLKIEIIIMVIINISS